ncbi:STM3941 family protein [Alistipes putredinis]|uniref:STM3941 family protein n=1 Tax=Alistipes putredinis TaxID=28117 RepID=UPI003A8C6417
MKKETAIYPSHRKLLGTTLAAAIMTTLSCLLVIVQPHGKVGLVIGIVGAVFFGGCICILFIVLLKNFFRNRPTLLLTPDSLRIYVPAKGIYITIEWQRIADFSVFRTYGQKFIRIELHDPDRAIDEEKNRIAKGLMRWQMKYFGSPYAITASTVDIGTAELEKILREYLQASREI